MAYKVEHCKRCFKNHTWKTPGYLRSSTSISLMCWYVDFYDPLCCSLSVSHQALHFLVRSGCYGLYSFWLLVASSCRLLRRRFYFTMISLLVRVWSWCPTLPFTSRWWLSVARTSSSKSTTESIFREHFPICHCPAVQRCNWLVIVIDLKLITTVLRSFLFA